MEIARPAEPFQLTFAKFGWVGPSTIYEVATLVEQSVRANEYYLCGTRRGKLRSAYVKLPCDA